MKDPEYRPIQSHTPQQEQLMTLGETLASEKLDAKDLAAVIAKHHLNPPQVAYSQSPDTKLLIGQEKIHH